MNLKRIRKDRGFTQKQVAEMTGLSESAVCLIENGKRCPNFKITKRIADALGVTVDELIRDE